MTTAVLPPSDSVASPAEADLPAILERLRIALVTLQTEPATMEVMGRLNQARFEAARVAQRLPRRHLTHAVGAQILSLVRQMRELGVYDERPAEEAVTEFGQGGLKVPGILAAMLVLPAWKVPGAPLLGEAPEWMWGEYSEWLFAAPLRPLSATEADDCAAHWLRQAQELSRWMERNLGSASVRRAAEAFVQCFSLAPLAPMNEQLRPLAQTRARILTRLHAPAPLAESPVVTPRSGRALRVGVLVRRFLASGEAYAALARFEQLDRAQFEVTALALHDSDSALAGHVRSKAAAYQVLPEEPAAQVACLRESGFDVLVFAGDLAGGFDAFARLALHRTAPLQVRLGGAGSTCGLPEIDLTIAADPAAAAEQFTERLGVVRGPALAYALQSVADEVVPGFERAALGVPEGMVLLATVVGPAQLGPTQVTAWARVLAEAPSTHLLVYVGPGRTFAPAAAARLQSQLDLALAAGGVAASRVTILASPESTHLEARGLLRLADLFLAPLTGGDPVWVAEALAAGVPAVVAGSVGGGRGLLPADVAAELTAESEDDYVRQAVRLASDATARCAAAQRIAATLESGVDFLDTLAASDAYGDLLQTAFDELETTGREAFRAERTPLASPVAGRMEDLLAAAAAAQADGDWGAVRRWLEDARRIDPRAVNVRALYGRALAAERAPERAAAYFLAALQQRPEEAEWWFELAGALRASGQNAQAIQALEASLRLDRSRSEGWLLLIDLAEEAGAADIAREAFEALRLIAPDHPRIAPLAERLAS